MHIENAGIDYAWYAALATGVEPRSEITLRRGK